MQFDRDKSFGYPVLRPVFEDEKIKNMDFPRAQFEPVFDLKRSVENPNVAELEYEFTVSVPEMEDEIRSQKLSIKVDIRCGRTFFAKQYDVGFDGVIEIDLTNLRDVIEVHPYVVATEDFTFSSKSIHPDFGFDSFLLKKGSIIAWHPPMPFSIEKEQYRTVRSIIDFHPNPEIKYGEYILGTENDYVVVYAHPDFVSQCRAAENIQDAQLGLLSSFYIPIIAELLLELAKDGEKADTLRWASIIRAKADALKLEWSDELKSIQNAQKLLRNPLSEFSKKAFLSS
ncbi:hypothetical protein [Candidatus Ponderosibacter sp. Uisw_141_02]|uniref:hypothetical protein n=1 Tax=Candidatus Ponderosibacter sp. Uisw_141_02 TaxID=3231000 RepID=UPI003D4AF6DF